jgi:hypothetical protein
MVNFKSFVLFSVVISLFGLFGCGEAVKDGGRYTVKGKVYRYVYMNSSNYDNSKYYTEPVSGATWTLVNSSGTYSTLTNSTGDFTLSDVPGYGSFALYITKEGFVRYASSFYIDPPAVSGTTLNNLYILFPNPYVTRVVLTGVGEVSPEVVVSTTIATFEIYFSKAMDKTTITPLVVYSGVRTNSIGALGVQPVIMSGWITDKVLSVTAFNLATDANYHLGIANVNKYSYGYIFDTEGNCFSSSATPYFYNNSSTNSLASGSVSYAYMPFRTATNQTTAPGKVANLRAYSGYSMSTNIDYSNVDYAYDIVSLCWDATAEATSYRVYASIGGNYQLVKTVGGNGTYITGSEIDSALAGYDRIGVGSYPIDPGLPWPFLGSGVSFVVTAYNSLGESGWSNVLAVKDNVAPTVWQINEQSDTVKLFYFTEPLDRTSAENVANYSILGQTIVSATLFNNYNDGDATYVRLVLNPGVASDTLTINNVKDLSNNTIAAGTTVTF